MPSIHSSVIYILAVSIFFCCNHPNSSQVSLELIKDIRLGVLSSTLFGPVTFFSCNLYRSINEIEALPSRSSLAFPLMWMILGCKSYSFSPETLFFFPPPPIFAAAEGSIAPPKWHALFPRTRRRKDQNAGGVVRERRVKVQHREREQGGDNGVIKTAEEGAADREARVMEKCIACRMKRR